MVIYLTAPAAPATSPAPGAAAVRSAPAPPATRPMGTGRQRQEAPKNARFGESVSS